MKLKRPLKSEKERKEDREHEPFLLYLEREGFVEMSSRLISLGKKDRLFVQLETGLSVLLRWEQNKGGPAFYYYELYQLSFNLIPTTVSYGSKFNDLAAMVKRHQSAGSNGPYCGSSLDKQTSAKTESLLKMFSRENSDMKARLERLEKSCDITDGLLPPEDAQD